jgi:hypothetical protein
LEIVPLADVADAINKLLNEKSAGVASGGSIDFIWINGENFRTAGGRTPVGPVRHAAAEHPLLRRNGVAARLQDADRRPRSASRAGAVRPRLRLGARRRRQRPSPICARGSTRTPPLHVSGDSRLHRVGIRPPRAAARRRHPPAAFANGFDADL